MNYKNKMIRLFSAAVAALTACTLLTACSGGTDSAADPALSEDTTAAETAEEVSATALYQPQEGEQRMMDLLNEIQSTGKVSLLYGTGDDKAMVFSYGKETDQYVILDYAWLTHSADPTTQLGGDLAMLCYRLIQKDGDDYVGYWIDPDQKIYGYSMGTVTDNGDGRTDANFIEGIYENAEYLTGIPSFLTPEYWSFVSSGTEEIDGIVYYMETYTYYTSTQHLMFNVLFDGRGDMAYIGASEYDDSRSLMDTSCTENEYALKSLLREPSVNIDLSGSIAPSSMVCPVCKQYLDICFKPEFDSSLYHLDEYETITNTFEFKEKLISEKYEAIKAELGLDFDF